METVQRVNTRPSAGWWSAQTGGGISVRNVWKHRPQTPTAPPGASHHFQSRKGGVGEGWKRKEDQLDVSE